MVLTEENMKKVLERKLKKGTEVIIERKLDERGSKGTKKVRETAVVDDVYSHIFLVRLSSGRLESFRYVQFFSDDDERVRIYDSKRKKT